jgi:hypothetical protein
LQVQYLLSSVTFKSSADGILYEEKGRQSKGFMLAQSAGWKPAACPFQADVYAAYFHTDDYDTRLSAYEKNILYAFHTSQLYGKGVRLSATFRWKLPQNLTLSGKLGYTRYSDRDKIGTELEEIQGNHKTDLSLLLQWKF